MGKATVNYLDGDSVRVGDVVIDFADLDGGVNNPKATEAIEALREILAKPANVWGGWPGRELAEGDARAERAKARADWPTRRIEGKDPGNG